LYESYIDITPSACQGLGPRHSHRAPGLPLVSAPMTIRWSKTRPGCSVSPALAAGRPAGYRRDGRRWTLHPRARRGVRALGRAGGLAPFSPGSQLARRQAPGTEAGLVGRVRDLPEIGPVDLHGEDVGTKAGLNEVDDESGSIGRPVQRVGLIASRGAISFGGAERSATLKISAACAIAPAIQAPSGENAIPTPSWSPSRRSPLPSTLMSQNSPRAFASSVMRTKTSAPSVVERLTPAQRRTVLECAAFVLQRDGEP